MPKVLSAVLFLLFVCPSLSWADYTAVRPHSRFAQLTGNADGDELVIDSVNDVYRHNRFAAGDAGFESELDWDSTVAGIQPLVLSSTRIVIDAGGGIDRLFVDDRFMPSAANATYLVTATAIEREGAVRIEFNDTSLMEDVLLGTGSGTNVVTVRSSDSRTPDSLPLTIHLGNGNDRVNLGDANLDLLQGRIRVIGGSGTDSIAVFDTSTTRPSTFQITSTTVHRGDGQAVATYEEFENLGIAAGSGNDVFNVSSTAHQTSIQGGLGNNRLALADGITLRGGSYTGGAGLDTLDYSAWTTPIVANMGDRHILRAVLSADTVVPATTSTAAGVAWLIYTPATSTVDLLVELSGISITDLQSTSAHLHRGAPGVNDTSSSTSFSRGEWAETGTTITLDTTPSFVSSTVLSELLNGNAYIDIHTAAFPAGELRGQFSIVSLARSATGVFAPLNVDGVIATGGDDHLFGSDLPETLDARDGADVVLGFGGADTLTGGVGNDFLVGGAGQDIILGGEGDDTIVILPGDRGVWSDAAVNRIEGGAGSDRVRMSTGSNTDVVSVVRHDGIAGFSVMMASTSFGVWTYTSEHITGVEAMAVSLGGAGDSLQVADIGPAGLLDFRVSGGNSDDTMSAALLPAGILTTLLFDGGESADTLEGSAGADILRGDASGDTLTGGPGNDTILGGAGDDTVVWKDGDGTDTIDAGTGSFDTFSVGSKGDGATMTFGVVAGALRVQVAASTFSFDHTVAGLERFTLVGTVAEDLFTITAPAPSVSVNGFGGADRLHFDAGCQAISQSTSFIRSGTTEVSMTSIEGVTTANTIAVSASSTSFSSGGGMGTATVTGSCTWNASTTTPWIVLAPTSGTGNGTVTYRVVPNLLRNSRGGSIIVAGQSFSIFQSGASTTPTSRNDFNGDGTFDLLLHHEIDGTIGVWSMNGNLRVDGSTFTPNRVPDVHWTIVGVGDFNGDAKPDLLWQHDDGFLAVWLMNGRTRIDAVFLTPNGFADRAWRVRAVADVNRDGHPDLIIEHSTSAHIGVWFMNGTTMTDARLMTPSFMSSEWEIVGAADLDGNGSVDLIFQHDEGYLAAWYMSGTTRLGDPAFLSPNRTPSAAWRVRSVGDIDHDGDADLVIQNMETGELAVYIMNGSTALYSIPLAPDRVPEPAWKIVGPR